MDCNKWIPDSWVSDTRLWFYTTEQPLSDVQQAYVLNMGTLFFKKWSAHGQPLLADWLMPNPQLLVLAVFPGTEPTGCSLDKVSGLIGRIEHDLGLDFRNRKRLVWVRDLDAIFGEAVHLENELESGSGWLNIYANTAKEFRDNPILPKNTAWIKRMFNPISFP